jgi:hypothetical protein
MRELLNSTHTDTYIVRKREKNKIVDMSEETMGGEKGKDNVRDQNILKYLIYI